MRVVPRRLGARLRGVHVDAQSLVQGLVALALNSSTSIVAGLVLSSITDTFRLLPGLLVMVPAAIGLRGQRLLGLREPAQHGNPHRPVPSRAPTGQRRRRQRCRVAPAHTRLLGRVGPRRQGRRGGIRGRPNDQRVRLGHHLGARGDARLGRRSGRRHGSGRHGRPLRPRPRQPRRAARIDARRRAHPPGAVAGRRTRARDRPRCPTRRWLDRGRDRRPRDRCRLPRGVVARHHPAVVAGAHRCVGAQHVGRARHREAARHVSPVSGAAHPDPRVREQRRRRWVAF